MVYTEFCKTAPLYKNVMTLADKAFSRVEEINDDG